MNNYETMYIIRPTVEDEARQQLVERFSSLVSNSGGNVEKIDDWGRRRFSYEIDDLTEGYYILMHFQAPTDLPRELERNFNINENIMRYIVIRKDESDRPETEIAAPSEPEAVTEPEADQQVSAPGEQADAEPVAAQEAEAGTEAEQPAAEPEPSDA